MILNYISHAATSHHPCTIHTISGQYAWDVMFIWGGVIKRVNGHLILEFHSGLGGGERV